MTHRIGLAFLALCCLTGCLTLAPVRDATRYYLLPAPEDETTDRPDAVRIGLHPLALPPYLDRREIVIHRGDAEILYEDGHRWADGLKAALQRSLVRHLDAQQTIREVVPSPWVTRGFDRTLSVRIEACQGSESGEARLTASWEIQPAGVRRRRTFTGAYPPADMPALVETLGDLVGELAEAIGGDV